LRSEARAKYPEILGELQELILARFIREGIAAERARRAAFELVEEVRHTLGGGSTYISSGFHYDLSQRDLEIFNKFMGNNLAQLAQEYGISKRRVYQIIRSILNQKKIVQFMTLRISQPSS